MSTITTRAAKGTPLTHAEVDANFTNLNADKLDTAGIALGSAASPTIKFTGDVNTGIYSPGADQVAVSTGGAERVRVDASGRVGIGTTGPSASLDVVSASTGVAEFNGPVNATVSFTGTSFAEGKIQCGAEFTIGSTNNFPTAFVTNNTERLRIDTSGNVGIGVSNPTLTGFTQVVRTKPATAGASGFYAENSDGAAWIGLYSGQSAVDGTALLYPSTSAFRIGTTTAIGTTGYVERLRIDSSGRVGIGTSSPQAKLHVETIPQAVNQSGSVIFGPNTNYGYEIRNVIDGSGFPRVEFRAPIAGTASMLFYSAGPKVFYDGGTTEHMRIDSSGRVGIGTTGPTNLLTVYDSGTPVADFVAGYIGSNSLGTGESRTWLTLQKGALGSNYGGAIGGYLSQGVGGGLIFGTQNATATPVERMRIDHTGIVYVLTSTTSASGTLFVNNPNNTSGSGVATLGNRANNNNTSSYYLVCQEPGVANRCFIYGNGNLANLNNVYGAISDIKLKENIADASSQWNDIKNLQIRKYNFKQNIGYQTHTQIGLVAQEAELVSPGLVYETTDRDSDGNDLGTVTKSVNYSVLYMKAVKALQEAMDRIETLEAKVAALEAP